MFNRLTLPSLVLAGALAFLGAPDTRVEAATCGGPGEQLCKENASCATFIFWRHCTTTYDYWNSDEETELEEIT